MTTTRKLQSDRLTMSRLTIRHQFKGAKKPTETTWRLMESAETMPFDALMKQLGSIERPADRAAICLSAAPRARTPHQIARLSIEISRRTDATTGIVNTLETNYPDSKVVQLVASRAARNFLSRLHSTPKETVSKTTKSKKTKELDSVSLKISSLR